MTPEEATEHLFHAVPRGIWKHVNSAIECCADVNARTPDNRHDTPLHLAAEYGQLRIADILMNNSADIFATNGDGLTPSQVALNCGHDEVLERIIGQEKYLERKKVVDDLEQETDPKKRKQILDALTKEDAEKRKAILAATEHKNLCSEQRPDQRHLYSVLEEREGTGDVVSRKSARRRPRDGEGRTT
jgi:hypothetical protein